MAIRWRGVAAGAAVVALAAACNGTPRSDVNGGAPVNVVSSVLDSALVLRGPDGATYVSRISPTFDQGLRKLRPDGTLDVNYDGDGDAITDFTAGAISGPDDGVVLADGSVVLLGNVNLYEIGARRLTPTGAIDTTYGTGGTVVTTDLYDGTGSDVCRVEPTGSLACATVASLGALRLGGYTGSGAPTTAATVTVDLGQFTTAGPPGTAETDIHVVATDVERAGSSTYVALEVFAEWWSAGGSYIGSSDTDALLVKVTGSSLDASFGSGGVRRIDPEVSGTDVVSGGAGTWSVTDLRLDVAADGRVTFWSGLDQTTGAGVAAVVGRTTPTGSLDTTWATDGLLGVRAPGGAAVEMSHAATRAGAAVTVAGASGGAPVVLRYTDAGVLDTGFDGDGMAVLPSPDDDPVRSLDLRNGAVTASVTGPIDSYESIDVIVLYG